MTKLHHTAYKKNYKKFILSTIEADGEGKPLKTDADKIAYLLAKFENECGFNTQRVGKQQAVADWLSGLALDIPFWNEDIIKLAVDMGSINPDPSEKIQERVTDNYWSFMANIILSFEPVKLIDYRLSLDKIL